MNSSWLSSIGVPDYSVLPSSRSVHSSPANQCYPLVISILFSELCSTGELCSPGEFCSAWSPIGLAASCSIIHPFNHYSTKSFDLEKSSSRSDNIWIGLARVTTPALRAVILLVASSSIFAKPPSARDSIYARYLSV